MTPETQLVSLLVVGLAAFAVPLLLALVPRAPIPIVVGEVSAGILLGESGLGWIETGPWLELLFVLGLAFLLFLAGLELDVRPLRRSLHGGARQALRSPLALALLGLAARLVLAFAITVPLAVAGLLASPTLVGILLTSTSLGVVLSVLKERALLAADYGQLVFVSAAVADFGTVVMLTVLFSAGSRSPAAQAALAALLVLLGLVLLGALRGVARAGRVGDAIERLAGSTAQVRVRGSLALLLGFVALAERLGLELILGAFVAGAIVSSLAARDDASRFRTKIDAIGYGVFIPAFFIVTGARLDLLSLLRNGGALALVPVLLAAVFVVKIVPAWLYRAHYRPRACVAAGVLQSAQLTLTIAGVEIGKRLGEIGEDVGSALILVALLSVLVAPPVFAYLTAPSESGPRAPAAGGEPPLPRRDGRASTIRSARRR
jgi:Kef-type K+ transport system membrane component KefB